MSYKHLTLQVKKGAAHTLCVFGTSWTIPKPFGKNCRSKLGNVPLPYTFCIGNIGMEIVVEK